MKKLVAFMMAFALCVLCFGTYGFEGIGADGDHAHAVVHAADDDLIVDDVSAYLYINRNKSNHTYNEATETLMVNIVIDSESTDRIKEASVKISAQRNLLGVPTVLYGTIFGENALAVTTVSSPSSYNSEIHIRVSASGSDTYPQNGSITLVFPVDDSYLGYSWMREQVLTLSGSVVTVDGDTINFDPASATYTVYVCAHAKTEYRVLKAATCEASGTKELYCTSCGYSLGTEIVLPTDHELDYTKAYNQAIEPYIAPTCKTFGHGCFKCKTCDKLITGNVPKLDHTFGDRKLIGGIYYYECAVCGTTEVASNQCSHPSENYTLVSVISQSTCTEAGSARYRCPVCLQTEERALPLADHSVGNGVITTAATCTTTGIKTSVCVVCEKTVVETIPALDHSYGTWNTVIEATCVSNGRETRSCTKCGKTESQDVVGTGHKFGSWTTAQAATCVSLGKAIQTCSLCKETNEQAIAMVAHMYGNWTTTTAPTCSATGVNTRVCATCSGTDTQIVAIDPTAHSYGEWEVVSNKTCVTDGEKSHTCALCGNVENEVDPSTGHVMGPATTEGKVTTSTCSVCAYEVQTKTVKNGVEKTLASTTGSLVLSGDDAGKDYAFEIGALDMEKEAYYKQYQSFDKAYTYKAVLNGEQVDLTSAMTMILEIDPSLEDYEVSLLVLRDNAFYHVNELDRNGNKVEIPGAELIGADEIFVVKGEEIKPNLIVPIVVTVLTLAIAAVAIVIFMKKGKNKEAF